MIRFYSTLLALSFLAAACASPLVRAAKQGQADEVRSLLADDRGHCGEALSEAAARNHEEALKVLLDGGCDVNSKDRDGYTPLMAAAAKGYDDCVRLLLLYKANADLLTWNDKTAVMLAKGGRHKGTAKLIESFDGVSFPAAPAAVKAAAPAASPDIPAAAPAAVPQASANALSADPRGFLHKPVSVRGRVQKIIASNGKEYGFGLAESGKIYSGARGTSSYAPLAGEKYLGVSSMVMLVDDQGGKCSFVFQKEMALPVAGQETSLTGRYLGDRLRAIKPSGLSALAPGVYLEALSPGDEASPAQPALPRE